MTSCTFACVIAWNMMSLPTFLIWPIIILNNLIIINRSCSIIFTDLINQIFIKMFIICNKVQREEGESSDNT